MNASRSALVAVALLSASLEGAEATQRDVFYVTLLKDARRGLSPIEHAAWLVRAPDGTERLVPWPPSGLSRAHMWQGPLPAGAVALLHTHPVDGEAEPSQKDRDTARRLGLPVYAITRWAVYRADADGTVSPVESPCWRPTIDWRRAEEVAKAVRRLPAGSPSGVRFPEAVAAVR